MKKMTRIAAGLAVFLMAAGAGCKEKEKVSTSAERTLVSEWTFRDGDSLLAFYSDGTFLVWDISDGGTYRGDASKNGKITMEMEGEGEVFVIIKGDTLSFEGDDEILTRVKN